MNHLEIQPKMMRHNEELNELKKYLLSTKEGQGNTVFIPSEAGVGKTRLVNELKEIAWSQGFQIFWGGTTWQ